MTTGNPALNEAAFEQESQLSFSRDDRMTVQGAAIKTGVLLTIVVACAAVAWGMVFPEGVSQYAEATTKQARMMSVKINREAMMGCLIGGGLGGFVLSLVMMFSRKSATYLAPLYAVCEGFFIGAISGVYSVGAYPGIVMNAAMLTIGVLGVMLTLYASRMIVMSDKLRTGIIAATGAVCLVYIASMVMNMFGMKMPYLHDTGPIGIGISAVIVCIAAFNLILDFDLIETSAKHGAPKYMEWYSAYGLLVTLVWLYLEMLRLLAKLRSDD
jgi:uncharacterized YccA/Bax inhibitor family protein